MPNPVDTQARDTAFSTLRSHVPVSGRRVSQPARARPSDVLASEFQEHAERLLAVAYRIVRDRDDARDVVQEAFLAAWCALERFEGRSRLSTWVHRIVVNAALMKLRTGQCRRETSAASPLARATPLVEEVCEKGADLVAAEVERREVRILVRRCIERLPQRYRSVVLLRDIAELDTRAAAHVLAVSPNAVKVRLHRARRELRALVSGLLATFGGARDGADVGAPPLSA